MLATNAANGGSRQRRVGEGHLGPTQDSVNALFAMMEKIPPLVSVTRNNFIIVLNVELQGT